MINGIYIFDFHSSFSFSVSPFGVASNRPPIAACALPHANIFRHTHSKHTHTPHTNHSHTQLWIGVENRRPGKSFPCFCRCCCGTLTQFSMADVPKPCSPLPPVLPPAVLSLRIGILSTCFYFFSSYFLYRHLWRCRQMSKG